MKKAVKQYHLTEGAIVATIFPLLFVLSDGHPTHVAARFVSTFTIMLGIWMVNFSLVQFKQPSLLNKYLAVALSYCLSIAIYSIVGWIFSSLGAIVLSAERGNWGNSFNTWMYLCLKIAIFNTLILLVKHAYDSAAENKQMALENEILKTENLNAQHEALKQQVNPHFLFNSLNTLKSLTKHDPEQAVHFIRELALVYRYMLQHQDKKIVTIKEELDFLRSYLYLLSIRFGEAICITIEVPPAIQHHTIPSNTLQLLIENTVKHNTLSLKKPLHIAVLITNNCLVVQNTLQVKPAETASSGLGLQNISHRYILLKGKDITIEKTNTHFTVSLPIV